MFSFSCASQLKESSFEFGIENVPFELITTNYDDIVCDSIIRLLYVEHSTVAGIETK